MSHAMDHHDKTIALLGEAKATIATQAATIEALEKGRDLRTQEYNKLIERNAALVGAARAVVEKRTTTGIRTANLCTAVDALAALIGGGE